MPEAPKDPVMNLFMTCVEDKHPFKVDLSIGTYRNELGKPVLFDSIKISQKLIANDPFQTKVTYTFIHYL